MSEPWGVTVDGNGNVYIAAASKYFVRVVTNGTVGIITTVAGTGIEGFAGDYGAPTSAQLNFPRAVAVDSSGIIYIADNHRIREVISIPVAHPTSSPSRPTESPTVSPTSEPTFAPTSSVPSLEPTGRPTEWNPYMVRI